MIFFALGYFNSICLWRYHCLEQLLPWMQPSRIVWQSSNKDHQFFIIPCVIIKLTRKLMLSFSFFIFILSFFPYQFPTWCPSLIVHDRRDCNCIFWMLFVFYLQRLVSSMCLLLFYFSIFWCYHTINDYPKEDLTSIRI